MHIHSWFGDGSIHENKYNGACVNVLLELMPVVSGYVMCLLHRDIFPIAYESTYMVRGTIWHELNAQN